jgi:HD-GYP domain-containing protein (c-di-GMP phosphodiesterase class II)
MEWKGTTAGPRSAHADSTNQAQRHRGSSPQRAGLRLGDPRADLSFEGRRPAHISTPEPIGRSSVPRGGRREMVLGLLAALRRKDAYTERHSVQVATYARCLAERLGVDPALREDICAAAALHDIGKIGIPDAILLKPAKLTHNEFEVMKLHPAMGETILEPAGAVRSIATLILHHHEWHDGTGYPGGLRGADIPFGAKVIQAADCIDAMRSPRCYKRGFGLSKVIAELRSGSGIQFDPTVVDVAVAWLEDKPRCVVSTHFDTRLHRAAQAELHV